MNSQPKVSIITPSYNRADFIEETIESIINQTYSNIEYWVIDGGSEDETIKILNKYQKQGSLKFISEKDGGMYDAINKGLKLASGEILAYLNTDDRYFPWTIETVVQAFIEDNNACQIVFGDSLVTNSLSSEQQINIYPRYASTWLRNGAIISQPTVFFKRTVYETVGEFSKDVRLIADCEYWLRVSEKGHKFKKINEVLAIELNHGDTLRTKYEDEINAEKRFLISRYRTNIFGVTPLRKLYLRWKYLEKEYLSLRFAQLSRSNKRIHWSNFLGAFHVRFNWLAHISKKLRLSRKPVWTIKSSQK